MNGGLEKLGTVLEFFLTTTLNLQQGYPLGVTLWGVTLFPQEGMLVKPMGMKQNLFIQNLLLKR